MKPPTQAEFFLRLAENNEAKGEEANAEINRIGREHALALLDEHELLTKAMEINRLGRERFAHFMPRTQPRNLADQRAALIQGGKNEAPTPQEQRPAGGQRS